MSTSCYDAPQRKRLVGCGCLVAQRMAHSSGSWRFLQNAIITQCAMEQCQSSRSGVGKVLKTMGQSLWINISDMPQSFSKCCTNENCQQTMKEYLCWVSFSFVTFPWKETEFNATLILAHQYTLHGTIFFRCCEKGHLISQLHPAPILIGQIWNFAAYQNRFCSLAWCLK